MKTFNCPSCNKELPASKFRSIAGTKITAYCTDCEKIKYKERKKTLKKPWTMEQIKEYNRNNPFIDLRAKYRLIKDIEQGHV